MTLMRMNPPAAARPGILRSDTGPSYLKDAGVNAACLGAPSAIYWVSSLLDTGKAGFQRDEAFIHAQFAGNLLKDGQMALRRALMTTLRARYSRDAGGQIAAQRIPNRDF